MKLPKTIMDAVRGSVGGAMILAAGCGGNVLDVDDPIEEPVAVAAPKPAERAPLPPIDTVEHVSVDESDPHEVGVDAREPHRVSSHPYDLDSIPPPCGRG